MTARISDAERFRLLNDLETEVTFLRDLVEVIAENLLEVSPTSLPDNAGHHVRLATTLAIVTRDRANEACRQMNDLYGVNE